jgi:hypothetical protein
MGLTVIKSQVAVNDSTSTIGTAVDLLCVNSAGAIAVLEIKVCGMQQDKYKRSNLIHTHQVQLGLTRLLYDRSNPHRPSARGVLICSGPWGAHAYNLDRAVWSTCEALCAKLMNKLKM